MDGQCSSCNESICMAVRPDRLAWLLLSGWTPYCLTALLPYCLVRGLRSTVYSVLLSISNRNGGTRPW